MFARQTTFLSPDTFPSIKEFRHVAFACLVVSIALSC
jgi:hypothetical protein